MRPLGLAGRPVAGASHFSVRPCAALAVLLLAALTLSPGRDARALAQAQDALEPQPQAERISPTEIRIDRMIVDEACRCLRVPGRVNMDTGLVEVLACTPTGKVHESVLVLDVRPYVLQVGLLLLGLRPSADPDSADRVAIHIVYGTRPPVPADRLLVDARTGAHIADVGWWFRGSRVLQGIFSAEVSGTLVATYADPTAILDNPRDNAVDDEIISIDPQVVPAKGDSVEVRFSKWSRSDGERTGLRQGRAVGAASAAATALPTPWSVVGDSLPLAGMTAPVVVTASRLRQPLQEYPGSVLVLGRKDMAQLPAVHAGTLLQMVPGLHLFDPTASGSRPVIAPRGFTGAGEGEYVELLVDGIPANELQKGIADFNLLPLVQLQRFEALRGPASAVYGDLATAGVVQLESRPITAPELTLRGGAYGAIAAEIGAGYSRASGYFGGSAGWMQADGWRDNSRWREGKLLARAAAKLGKQILAATALASFSDIGEPGPVPRDWLVTQPEMALFPRDGQESTRVLAGVRLTGPIRGPVEHESQVYVRTRDADVIRTLAASMGLMEERRESVEERAVGAEVRTLARLWDGRELLQVGFECERGTLSDAYFDADATAIAAAGDVGRLKVAPYLQSVTAVGRRVDLSLGGRYDYFHLRSDQTVGGEGRLRRDMDRFTARSALNWKWGQGNLYVSASSLFKIPTLGQLYDLRHPLGLPLSNPDLVPQQGTSLEVGARWQPAKRSLAEIVLYRIRMRDEIVFDPGTFVYQNIGRSDHDGIEVALLGRWVDRLTTRVVYTWTDGFFRSGEANGHRINGIPAHRAIFALDVDLPYELNVGATVELNGAQYLDEANSRELRGHGVAAFQIRHDNGSVRSYAQLENLFDRRCGTSGYVLPFDGTELIYPGPPRRFTVGVEVFP